MKLYHVKEARLFGMLGVGIVVLAAMMSGCSPAREVVQIYKGDPGTGCSVSDLLSSGEGPTTVVGAKISCTDGTSSLILNGATGATGAQGAAGTSCSVARPHHASYVNITCGSVTQRLYDGEDGRDGRDGEDGIGCKVQQLQGKVKITCGSNSSYAYVYDGQEGEDGKDGKDGKNGTNGTNGTSCVVTQASGGANVKCGSAPAVFIANGATGPQGSVGPQGQPGRDGLNGANGEDAVKPGLSCNVHDLSNWDGVTNILTVLSASAPKGNFTLANLNVGDSPSANGFPGMPSALQSQVGLEGYALDCYGYLNVETSGLYNFSMLSDDGVRLVIQDQVIINNPGLHAPTTDLASNRELQRGPNKINVVYYQGPHTQIALQLKWSGPNLSQQVVPAARFTH